MSDTDRVEEYGVVVSKLGANLERRRAAEAELSAAKDELRGLLFRGQKAAIEVAEMADAAGISRDTAHAILKEGGVMSWKQKQAWAGEILELVPRGSYEQNEFRAMLQMTLYKALGSNPEGLPRSVQGVFDSATHAMRTIGRRPGFRPVITDSEKLRTYEWPTEPFEILQRGRAAKARFQLRQGGVAIGPWRSSADDVARDLRAAGGGRPAFIDRTGPECVASNGRRIGWDALRDV
jgi:hypothetical protein